MYTVISREATREVPSTACLRLLYRVDRALQAGADKQEEGSGERIVRRRCGQTWNYEMECILLYGRVAFS